MGTIRHMTAQDFLREFHAQGLLVDTDRLADVTAIQKKIVAEGDAALLEYTAKFDGVDVSDFQIKVSPEEIKAAYEQVSDPLLSAMKASHDQIMSFHEQQQPQDWRESIDQGFRGVQYRPIEKVALYVPGGRAVYPSSVLMNGVPSKIAGVKDRILLSPPDAAGHLNPLVLVAADLCGITQLYKVGGAQAIFAVSCGATSLPQVDKVVGPGNIYVTLAKQLVYGRVDIDKPAGPSEVLVVLDEASYVPYAVAELFAQLEHDPLCSAVCVSTSPALSEAVQAAVQVSLASCKRREIIEAAMANSYLVTCENWDQIPDVINHVASEHVCLVTDRYDSLLPHIHHAGAIFCGPYTPVALGDFYAGPNHVLPTSGTARFASPLGVMDFMKHSTLLHYDRPGLAKVTPEVALLARSEDLDAHAVACEIRVSEDGLDG